MHDPHLFIEVQRTVPVVLDRVSIPMGAEGYNPLENDYRVLAQMALLSAERYEAYQEARTDSLTGAGNLRAFNERMSDCLEQAKATDDGTLALIYIDVDGMKRLNDIEEGGHEQGDAVLRLISGVVRERDQIYRVGGDEFAVPLLGFQPAKDDETGVITARRIAERLENRLNVAISDNAKWFDVHAGVSVGVAVYEDGDDSDSLKQRADIDMARNKIARKRHLEERGIVFQDDRIVELAPVVKARRKREGWGQTDDFGNAIL